MDQGSQEGPSPDVCGPRKQWGPGESDIPVWPDFSEMPGVGHGRSLHGRGSRQGLPRREGRNDAPKAGREDQNEFPQWANPAASNSQQGQGHEQGGNTPLTRTGLCWLHCCLVIAFLLLSLIFLFAQDRGSLKTLDLSGEMLISSQGRSSTDRLLP